MSIDEQIKSLSRRCERIISEDELRKKLERSAKSGKPLRVKFGMDPTAPDVTLGHIVPLSVIRQFQDWGHKAVLIIGDYTARVGDPSGRNTTRPILSGEEIDRNATTYVAQIGKVLLTDDAHLEVRYNGEWFSKMNLIDILRLTSQKTVAQMIAREDFHNRFTQQVDIRIHEFLYPLMQGHDSVMIDADIEFGGSDQLFNNLVGRDLQASAGKESQVVIVTPLLVGTDGKIKMSKSKGNYIGVTESAREMFGKVMSLPDDVMEMYYTLATDEPSEKYRPLIQNDPRNAKVALAKHVIAQFHSRGDADAAEQAFVKQFVKQEIPDEMPEFSVGPGPHKIAPLLVAAKLATSNGEGNRKVGEGAVSIDGEKVTDFKKEITLEKPAVIKLGRKFARVKP